MLVLSRGREESIRIGSDVLVTVMEIRGASVRLGIEAPRSTAVHREEVVLRIAKEISETPESDVARPPRTSPLIKMKRD